MLLLFVCVCVYNLLYIYITQKVVVHKPQIYVLPYIHIIRTHAHKKVHRSFATKAQALSINKLNESPSSSSIHSPNYRQVSLHRTLAQRNCLGSSESQNCTV